MDTLVGRTSPGRLVVITGCMFAGKTARLIGRLQAAQAAGGRVVACKHPLDSRYDPGRLVTHDQRAFPAVCVAEAAYLLSAAARADVVGIDEAQFYGRPLVPVCIKLRDAGRTVIVAGIDHDTWGQPFPPLPELTALADEVNLLRPPCAVCGQPAEFHQRLVPVAGGQLVGGPREYQPRCRAHFCPLPRPAPAYP